MYFCFQRIECKKDAYWRYYNHFPAGTSASLVPVSSMTAFLRFHKRMSAISIALVCSYLSLRFAATSPSLCCFSSTVDTLFFSTPRTGALLLPSNLSLILLMFQNSPDKHRTVIVMVGRAYGCLRHCECIRALRLWVLQSSLHLGCQTWACFAE